MIKRYWKDAAIVAGIIFLVWLAHMWRQGKLQSQDVVGGIDYGMHGEAATQPLDFGTFGGATVYGPEAIGQGNS